MLYTVNTDNEGYVLSISNTKNDKIDIELDNIELQYLNAYKLISNTLVLDEERKQSIVAEKQEEAKQEEIIDLKERLNSTDYIMAETFEDIMALDNALTFIADFISIIKSFKNQYSEMIANRKQWRARIKELEK